MVQELVDGGTFLLNCSWAVSYTHLKLGFRKEEIRLYYPLISLNHFFEADDDVDEMQTRLEQFPEEVKKKLGDICVTHKKDRFCLHIPEQGSVYVHEHMAENEFIKRCV